MYYVHTRIMNACTRRQSDSGVRLRLGGETHRCRPVPTPIVAINAGGLLLAAQSLRPVATRYALSLYGDSKAPYGPRDFSYQLSSQQAMIIVDLRQVAMPGQAFARW